MLAARYVQGLTIVPTVAMEVAVPASRAFWKGYLKLSFVSCPVALYPATSAAEQVERPTGEIAYKKLSVGQASERRRRDRESPERFELLSGSGFFPSGRQIRGPQTTAHKIAKNILTLQGRNGFSLVDKAARDAGAIFPIVFQPWIHQAFGGTAGCGLVAVRGFT